MQMECSGNGCLSLILSEEELARLGLSFEELDQQNPKTRRMLRTLLQLARRRTGFAPKGALLVEALPLEGGCLLLVSPKDPILPAAASPTVFWVADGDALLQIAAGGPLTHPLGEGSSLYRGQEGFWLILYGGATAPVLLECGQELADGATAAAYAAEHGEPLFIGDALPRLRRLTDCE
ncbi:MAG: adaptor protein MecA [Clostridia bacterium]|nr:adaptor protein MecA [Clostridia bacterium]